MGERVSARDLRGQRDVAKHRAPCLVHSAPGVPEHGVDALQNGISGSPTGHSRFYAARVPQLGCTK